MAKIIPARIFWMAGVSSALILLIAGYLHWPQEAHAVPANDNLADAIQLSDTTLPGIMATGSNVGALIEGGEQFSLTSCQPSGTVINVGRTVWYRWTSPNQSGEVAFDTWGSDFDTTLGIFTGSAYPLTLIACNDDRFTTTQSAVTFSYAANTDYYIQVSGFSGLQGNFVLNMSLGELHYVSINTDNTTADSSLTLREAMGRVAAGAALGAGEQAWVLNYNAANRFPGDLIHFTTAHAITLAVNLPFLSGTGDNVSGVGHVPSVNGNNVGLCFNLTGTSNRVETLGINNCGATAAIQVSGAGNIVGGELAVQRNVIQGPGAVGVRITGGSGHGVYGNFISFNSGGVFGTQLTRGILIENATNNVIGGPGGKGNLVIGLSYGIHIASTSSANAIQGNKIGTDIAGLQDLSSATSGILIDGPGNDIGGPNPGEGNLLSGNLTGIQTTNTGYGNRIWGNFIGTDVSGLQTLPGALNGNDSHGLWMDSRDNIIGGLNPGEANIIAFNGGSGIHQSGTGNRNNLVRGNSIHSNLGAPIVIQATALPPQNPVIGSVSGGIISGFVCASCTVDIYNDIAEEGRIYLGSTVANVDGTFSVQGLGYNLANITITATGSNNWTSRYSAPFTAAPNSDGDALPNGEDGCTLAPEDYDGFEDGDGCPDADNDGDGICDAGLSAPSCTGSDLGRTLWQNPLGGTVDCRNMAEDIDGFHDDDGCPEPDNDYDTFPDHTDDCPATDATVGADGIADTGDEPVLYLTPYQSREDFDGVIDTDGCHDSPDDDYDGDGLGDEFEVFSLATDPINPDSDGDAHVDGSDNCALWANAAQNLPSWPIPANDADCDGFSSQREGIIGTDPTRQCPVAGTPDAWPVDITKSGNVNIADVTAFKPVFLQSVPPGPARYDLNASGAINIADVTLLKPFFLQSCTP